MDYTKQMIDLVFSIRKSLPPESRQAVKLSSDELPDVLARCYRDVANDSSRERIETLFDLVGPAWQSKVSLSSASPSL